MLKYIKLFESFQGFNKSEEDNEREYHVSLDKLLTWAVDQNWSDDWYWIPDILMVNDEFPDEDDSIGYVELLKKNRELEITVYSQLVDGQIDSSWVIGATVFDLITFDWPFEDADNLSNLEETTVKKLAEEIGETGLAEIGATIIDIIDFVDWSSDRGEDSTTLTTTGFRNWLELQRGSIN